MNFTQQSLDYLTQDSCCSVASDHENTQSESTSSSSTIPNPLSPVLQALKGYSLYKHDEKLEAVVAFLRLSSYKPIFSSGDLTNIAKIEALTEEPKMLLRGRKGSCKYPSKWTSHFCAQFIYNAVELIEKDMKLSEQRLGRKNLRKKNFLPPAAVTLVQMVEQARLKVRSENISRKRKTTSRVKTAKDYLLKSTVHNPGFVEITHDQILEHLLCPMCNHRSLVSLTTQLEAQMANKAIRESFERKMKDWNVAGKKGSKPRMGKTESQILGCVCYMQNCINNDDGSGCFKCKQLGGSVSKDNDKG